MVMLVLTATILIGALLVVSMRTASHRWPAFANGAAWTAATLVFGLALIVVLGGLAVLFGWWQNRLT